MFQLHLYHQETTKNYENFLAKYLINQFVGMNIKKSDNKNKTNEFRYFIKSKFAGVNRLFVLVYSKDDAVSRTFKAKKYYLPKGIIDNYIVINGKNFYDQPIDSDIKRYEQIRNLTTAQGEDYTTRSLLDFEYTKNHYRLIAIDLSRQENRCRSKSNSTNTIRWIIKKTR